MKKWLMVAAALLLSAPAFGFTGAGGVWIAKPGDFVSRNRSGDQTGIADGITYMVPAGYMQLHPGTFLVSAQLDLGDSLEIRGAGMGRTILKHSGSTLHRIFSIVGKKKVVIRDLTIEGDMANVTTYPADRWARHPAIRLEDVQEVVLQNVEIRNTRGMGISGFRIVKFSMRDCLIRDLDSWGCQISGVADLVYEGNRVQNVWTHGLTADAYNAGNVWFEGVKGSRRIHVIGNTVIHTQNDSTKAASGIGFEYHEGDSAQVEDVLILGNHAKDNQSMGFSITTGERTDGFVKSRVVVMGNTSTGHTTAAGGSGIGCEIIGSNVSVIGNQFENNTFGTTVQNSRGVIIADNQYWTTIGSSQIGVILTPEAATDHVEELSVHDNLFYGGTGFQVSSTVTTTRHHQISVHDNKFRWTEKAILVQRQCDRMFIENNIIQNDTTGVLDGRGILAFGDGLKINGNHIHCPSGATVSAIALESSAASGLVQIQNNQITQAGKGIDFNGGATEVQLGGNRIGTMTTATIEDLLNCSTVRDEATNSWNFRTGAPTTEGWKAGQRVWHTAPSSQGNAGWICTASGTPGTWIEFGHNISDTNSPTFGSVTISGTDLIFPSAGAHVISATDATGTVRLLSNGVNRLEANTAGVNLVGTITATGKEIVTDSLRTNLGLFVGGQFVNKILRGSATLDFDLTAVQTQDLTFTLTGAAVGDEVVLGVPNGSVTATVEYTAWVSAANTIKVRADTLAVGENPASGTFKVTVVQ